MCSTSIGHTAVAVRFGKVAFAPTFTLKGYYASEEGAALGAGKVGEQFSFSFPATKEGLRNFLRKLRQ